MANPAKPRPFDGDARLEEQSYARENRTWIRLLGIVAFVLLVIASDNIGIKAKFNPSAATPFLICAACIGAAIVRPRRVTAILAVGGLLIWLMLRYVYV